MPCTEPNTALTAARPATAALASGSALEITAPRRRYAISSTSTMPAVAQRARLSAELRVRASISTEKLPGPLAVSVVPAGASAAANAASSAASAARCPAGSNAGARVSATSSARLPAASNHTSSSRRGSLAGCQRSASVSVSNVGSRATQGSTAKPPGDVRSRARASSATRKLVRSSTRVASSAASR